MIEPHSLRAVFAATYGAPPERLAFAPGRVNLIGEHIDYNGGWVLPATISMGVAAAVRFRTDRQIRIASKGFSGILTCHADSLPSQQDEAWMNYPLGVLHELKAAAYTLHGADLYLASDLPTGAGVSSSAALEVLTGIIFSHSRIDRQVLALLAQRAENNFVGVPCGIMDQFSIAVGTAKHALLLNCQTLEHQQIPLQLGGYSLILLDTHHPRALAESAYHERRSECEQALALLKQKLPIRTLVEATFTQLEELLADHPTLWMRARHVVSEQQRVLSAVQALKDGRAQHFGELLTASHNSLRDDYEVTGLFLDAMVSEALKAPGCLGARMTGAGFGGCAIALVEGHRVGDFVKQTLQGYQEATQLEGRGYAISFTGEAGWL
jgi:galactokinase